MFQGIADNYFDNFKLVFPLSSETRILDFGCGHGYLAYLLADRVKNVYIHDASPSMMEIARYANGKKNNVIALEKLPGNTPTMDYILANSVIQYMTPDILKDTLRLWRTLLKDEGKIIVSDVLTENLRFFSEILGLLTFSLSQGYLMGQLSQLASLLFSNYSKVARECPLTYYPHGLLRNLATETKLSVEILDKNLVYGRSRYSASLQKIEK